MQEKVDVAADLKDETNRFRYNSKEEQFKFGTPYIDYGARQYDRPSVAGSLRISSQRSTTTSVRMPSVETTLLIMLTYMVAILFMFLINRRDQMTEESKEKHILEKFMLK